MTVTGTVVDCSAAQTVDTAEQDSMHRTSEDELDGKLNLSRRGICRNETGEIRLFYGICNAPRHKATVIGRPEVGMIQQIEYFSSELYSPGVTEKAPRRVLVQGEIPGSQAGLRECISTDIADRTHCRQSKHIRVKPLLYAMRDDGLSIVDCWVVRDAP